MELADFLLARIAEDEATALEAQQTDMWGTPGSVARWRHESRGLNDGNGAGIVWNGRGQSVADTMHEQGAHIARWDPARVLAECGAKRRIVEEHETDRAAYPGTTIETDPCCMACSAGGEYPGEFPCVTIRLLALPYASHPAYRQEWKP